MKMKEDPTVEELFKAPMPDKIKPKIAKLGKALAQAMQNQRRATTLRLVPMKKDDDQ